ncbi:MAG: hypothetical protein JNL60_02625 [Bacteroidia bacterium]|nr:hypothetical protein [Bacteroidia bacterium]
MKKVLLIAAVAGLAFASCKKDYTCECTGTGYSAQAEYKKVKKKDAQSSCDKAADAAKAFGSDITCKLK